MFWNWCWNWWRGSDDNLTGSSGRDWLFGGRGNNTIDGGAGNDRIWGGRGDDIVYGGAGNDRVWGGRGDDALYGGDGNDKVKGGSGDDEVDGGAGSDRVYGGRGDDRGNYYLDENRDSKDYYNGGRGNDVLVLHMTRAEFDSDAVQADLEAYDAFLAGNGHGWGHHGHSFTFNAFDLKVKNWESYEIQYTDAEAGGSDAPVGGNSAPAAENDTVSEDAIVIPELEPNDPDFIDLAGSAQAIDRSSFRFAPTENVGDDSLPRVSIEGTIDPGDDVDLYAIELQAGETVILDIDFTGMPAPAPDTFLYLLDANGVRVAQNDDSFPEGSANPDGGAGSHSITDSYLEFTVPSTGAGAYYVGVQSFFSASTGPYTLNVSIGDSTDADLGGFEILADTLLANDSDIDGDALEIINVGNGINGSVELTTSGDVFFTPNSEHAASFEYTVSDGQGGESTATVTVNGNAVVGGAGNDALVGTSGSDLFTGGAGDDVFTGGDGHDAFVFSSGSGNDTINDFTVGTDELVLTGGMTASFVEQGSDTLVNFDTGDSVLLVGVTGIVDVNDLLA
jgi:Ca2+-binding RTX toxin-like protein